MWRFLYNLLFPIVFIIFIPGLWWKLKHRSGWKSTFSERFGRFSPARIEELKSFHGAVWIHAVSVGETVVALSLIKSMLAQDSKLKIVLSTTTTTGQELARKQAPERTSVIFCPIDYFSFVRKTFKVIRPSKLIIFETEIWPNMIAEAKKQGVATALVNARISDHSARGYRRAKCFFAPLLELFDIILAQSEADAERFRSISPKANVEVTGNLKFDQNVDPNLVAVPMDKIFNTPDLITLLAASTHPNEEALIAKTYLKLREKFANLRLVIVPRHAERGAEIATILESEKLTYHRRSLGTDVAPPIDVLLADTTGEMLALMKGADIVIMGKSLAGQDEGHNLIEPALLAKPIVTGAVLRNFRFVLNVLKDADAIATVENDEALEPTLNKLLANPLACKELGEKSYQAIKLHSGAINRTINRLNTI